MAKFLLVLVILCALVSQSICQKNGKSQTKSKKQAAPAASVQENVQKAPVVKENIATEKPPVDPPRVEQVSDQNQATPQVRQCRCDELEKCLQDETSQYVDLTSRCRHQCGLVFLSNDSAEHVANCYDAFEKSKHNRKTEKHRCVENLVSKPCVTDQQSQPSQTTLTVDPTKITQQRAKRNYKTLLPPNLNLYASCVKTCRKNGGIVHFNPDGTPGKIHQAKADANSNTPTAEAARATANQKHGKGYAGCAAKLNCQLVPVDKQLEKQAKQICKYQAPQNVDHELTLCTCLEGALNQNFQCVSPPVTENESRTCSASSSQSGEKTNCQQEKSTPAK